MLDISWYSCMVQPFFMLLSADQRAGSLLRAAVSDSLPRCKWKQSCAARRNSCARGAVTTPHCCAVTTPHCCASKCCASPSPRMDAAAAAELPWLRAPRHMQVLRRALTLRDADYQYSERGRGGGRGRGRGRGREAGAEQRRRARRLREAPGDWDCPLLQDRRAMNFASRRQCFRCGFANPKPPSKNRRRPNQFSWMEATRESGGPKAVVDAISPSLRPCGAAEPRRARSTGSQLIESRPSRRERLGPAPTLRDFTRSGLPVPSAAAVEEEDEAEDEGASKTKRRLRRPRGLDPDDRKELRESNLFRCGFANDPPSKNTKKAEPTGGPEKAAGPRPWWMRYPLPCGG